MTSSSTSFVMPREQFLAWRYLTLFGSASPQETAARDTQRHFFFWARNALFHALHALKVQAPAHVLLPAYLCKAAVEPFESFGARVEFYGVRRDCTLDLNEIETRIRPDTKVVLAVHYFGFPQSITDLRALCDRRKLFLFEDCAHVLRGQIGGRPLGSFGDASVFSYRKFLPMFDGAELLLRGGSLSENFKLERSQFFRQAAKHIFGQALDWSSGSTAKALSRGIGLLRGRRSQSKLPEVAEGPESKSQSVVDNNSASFDPALLKQPIAVPSRWVLRHTDVAAVAESRRENFKYLHDQLRNVAGISPLFDTLNEGVCPWVYPVVLDDVPNAHLLLRAAGIPAVTWGGVRPHRVSKKEFPDADFLYENLIFLPIHQNLSRNQLHSMAETVKRVRTQTRKSSPEKVPVAS